MTAVQIIQCITGEFSQYMYFNKLAEEFTENYEERVKNCSFAVTLL